MEVFFLGVTEPHWLTKTKVPLFLSRKRLLNDGRQRKTLPRARGIWAMDSGGFTELSDPKQPYPACYRVKPEVYAAEACRYMDEIGKMAWAAVQDWMCECKVLRRTGLTIRDHQLKTIESLFKLRAIAPQVPWTPVLQGWEVEDYENHVALYHENGVDLRCEPVVGLGTVCSRQATKEAEAIVQRLSRYDLRLHLFGFKSDGLPSTLNWVVSADSDAWSFVARTRRILLPGHVHPARKDSIDKKTGKIRWRKGARTDCRNCLE